ncbi:MAG: hypothetical protein ACP5NQ_08710 [Vulcanisaeta sp.]
MGCGFRHGQLSRGSIDEFIEGALEVIRLGREGLMSRDEVLDALWEFLINIDYEVRRCRVNSFETLMN